MFCRSSTENLFIDNHLTKYLTLVSMWKTIFWPQDVKLFFKVVLEWGTFDFEEDFWIHDFVHFMTQPNVYAMISTYQVMGCVGVANRERK